MVADTIAQKVKSMKTNEYITSPYISNKTSHNEGGGNHIISDQLMKMDYTVSHNYIDMLKNVMAGISYGEVVAMYGSELANMAILYKHILHSEKMWEYSNIIQASIEINTMCNWKCRYCPNYKSPYKKQYMKASLFREVLRKLDSYGRIKDLSLNFYGEPLLDNRLSDKLELILDTHMNLVLYTNGSLMDEKFFNAIKKFGNRATICINIPSLENEEFFELTGYKHLDKVIGNVEHLLQSNIKVLISVNGEKNNRKNNINKIMERFPSISIKGSDTIDRAGAVKNEFFQNISITEDKLFGCQAILHDLQIDVEGNVIICCQDFYKVHKLDNIQDFDSISDLLKSETIKKYRKKIYGAEEAPAEMICRKCIVMQENKSSSRFLLNKTYT